MKIRGLGWVGIAVVAICGQGYSLDFEPYQESFGYVSSAHYARDCDEYDEQTQQTTITCGRLLGDSQFNQYLGGCEDEEVGFGDRFCNTDPGAPHCTVGWSYLFYLQDRLFDPNDSDTEIAFDSDYQQETCGDVGG
jgi:hypothetical protein